MSASDPTVFAATEALPAADAAASQLRTDEQPELADPDLIAEYLDGNAAAYGELVRRHQIALFRLLLGLLADEDLAERACEEVFLVADRRLLELEDRAQFYRWLLGIARVIANELAEQIARDREREPPDAASTPREQLKREVHAVLQRLAPDQRLILVLVELRGAGAEEVAAALGCEIGEVPLMIAEAREAFTDILGSRAEVGMAAASPRAAPAVADIPELGPGDIVAERYRIRARLGAGGMGAVYAAEQIGGGVDVALKTMLPGLITKPSALRRFEREAEAIERVRHENFVRVLDHGRTEQGMPYLVMELLRGESLGDAFDRDGALDPRRALMLTRAVLDGLDHAHRVGVVHRDLKPDNVFLIAPGTDAEQPKILDLGLAKITRPSDDEAREQLTQLTQKGMVFGTPAYMAPEQALGDPVDHRADLYAVTVMLFQMLSGRLPFSASTASALLVQHVSRPAPPLTEFAPKFTVSAELVRLIEVGLAKQRDARFASAQAYLEAVEDVLAGPLPHSGSGPQLPPAAAVGRIAPTERLTATDSESPPSAAQPDPTPAQSVASTRSPWTWVVVGVVLAALTLVIWWLASR